MSKRRKRRTKDPAPPPELSGIAQLLSEMPAATLDLHGHTAAQARLRLRDFLTTHSRISAGSVVHVITGKSTAVLLELVRDMLGHEAAIHVDEYAGMLGGGGWVVRVK
jgi:DNA-nicking Smr family endonuclease